MKYAGKDISPYYYLGWAATATEVEYWDELSKIEEYAGEEDKGRGFVSGSEWQNLRDNLIKLRKLCESVDDLFS